MVRIVSDIFEVIVLATRTDTLLGIDRTLQLGKVTQRIDGLKENGFELIHS